MLNWLSRLICHSFGGMIPNIPPGGYNGVGRALFKLQKLNEAEDKAKLEEEEEEPEEGEE